MQITHNNIANNITVKLSLLLAFCITVAFLCHALVYTDFPKPQGNPGGTKSGTGMHQLAFSGKVIKAESTGMTVRNNEDIVSRNVANIGKAPTCTRLFIQQLPPCHIVGKTADNNEVMIELQVYSEEKLGILHGVGLISGGLYRPSDCSPRQKVAIVVPYRDRSIHLKVFLNNIHPFLKKQQIEYMIIVIEQAPETQFNRGMLRNIGFIEGEKICKFDCYFFHDIDMLPRHADNIYTCGDKPRHHSASLARWKYKLPYKEVFAGVVSFKKELFQRVNGYSNVYFGWGGEDDDLYNRIKYHKMDIERYPMAVSTYGDLRHKKSDKQGLRYVRLHNWKKRVRTDGLNSLKYTKYFVEFRKLYTWIYVGISESQVPSQGVQD